MSFMGHHGKHSEIRMRDIAALLQKLLVTENRKIILADAQHADITNKTVEKEARECKVTGPGFGGQRLIRGSKTKFVTSHNSSVKKTTPFCNETPLFPIVIEVNFFLMPK